MEEILIGTTDRSILVYIADPASTDGSGKTGLAHTDMTVTNTRVETDNDVVVTDYTSSLNALTNLTDAHNDWGWKEVSSTLAPGLYRLDVADALFATGAWYSVLNVIITTSLASVTPKIFKLVNLDMFGTPATNLATAGTNYSATRGLSGTALPAAAADAAGGLVISDAGGLDADAQRSDVAAILVDTGTTLDGRIPAALVGGRIDATIDGTGMETGAVDAILNRDASASTTNSTLGAIINDWEDTGRLDVILDARSSQTSVNTIDDNVDALLVQLRGLVLVTGTIGATGNDTTHLHLTGLAYGDDGPNDHLLVFFDNSTGLYYSRWISDFATSGDLATLGAALPVTPENSVDTYWITSIRQDVSGGSGLDAAGVRAAIGLASANLDTQLADLPTVAEFEARTLVAANYFDPAADTVARVTLVDTTTTNTDMRGTDSAATAAALASLVTTVGVAGAGLTAADDAVLAAIAALNNLSSAQVNTEADTALSDVGVTLARMGALTDWIDGGRLDLIIDAILARLPTRLTKNTAFTAFMFKMVDATDHVTAETGLTITATRSLDGGAFASCANSATEVSGGWYKINLDATDTNGNMVVLRFAGTGADTREVAIVTQP